MRVFGVVLLSLVVLVCSIEGQEDKYTTKFDNVDLDQILKSDRLLRNYVNCLLEKGNCTPDGLELKTHLPDAIETGCSKCSEKQREISKKVLRFMIKNKRNFWDELEKKYDPDGTYRKKYEAELKKEGIQL